MEGIQEQCEEAGRHRKHAEQEDGAADDGLDGAGHAGDGADIVEVADGAHGGCVAAHAIIRKRKGRFTRCA